MNTEVWTRTNEDGEEDTEFADDGTIALKERFEKPLSAAGVRVPKSMTLLNRVRKRSFIRWKYTVPEMLEESLHIPKKFFVERCAGVNQTTSQHSNQQCQVRRNFFQK